MTSVAAVVAEDLPPPEFDEHAATPLQTMATATRLTKPACLRSPVILPPACACRPMVMIRWACELILPIPHTSLSCFLEARAAASCMAAASGRCQHAADRAVLAVCPGPADNTGSTGRSPGFSARQRSSASGHLGLNGQPWLAAPALPAGRPARTAPVRRVLPRLSGSGADATSNCV